MSDTNSEKIGDYSFKIKRSPEDDCYIAHCPEFPGLTAFGDTRVEALKEGETALELFVEDFKDEGGELPEPDVLEYF